jgi:hypothetical protein
MLFPSEEDDSTPYLALSLNRGALFTGSGEISLEMDREERPLPILSRLTLSIEDRDKRRVHELSYTENLEEGFFSILPEEPLENGYYHISWELFGENGRLLESGNSDFFMVGSETGFSAIKVYPAGSIAPAASGLLFADFTDSGTGWLRWSSQKQVFASGPVEDFSDGAVWEAPLSEGVYTISVEFFPEPPPEHFGGDYPFISPVSRTVELYVDEDAERKSGLLGPGEAYRILYPFHGCLKHRGQADVNPEIVGSPRLFLHEGASDYFFGYLFRQNELIDIPWGPLFSDETAYRFASVATTVSPPPENGIALYSVSDSRGTLLASVLTEEYIPILLLHAGISSEEDQKASWADLVDSGEKWSGFGFSERSRVLKIVPEIDPPVSITAIWEVISRRGNTYVSLSDDTGLLYELEIELPLLPFSEEAKLRIGGREALFFGEFGAASVASMQGN